VVVVAVAVVDSAAVVANTAADVAVTKSNALFHERGLGKPASLFLFSRFARNGLPGAAWFFGGLSRKTKMIETKEQHIEVEGVIAVVLPGTMFRVELENKHMVLATICGKMRKRWVRLTVGDRVKMEMSPYDLNKARITWRLR
jgi:translation initiation factor IF-1